MANFRTLLANVKRRGMTVYSQDFWMIKEWMVEFNATSYHDLLLKIDRRLFNGKHIKEEFEKELAAPYEREEKIAVPFV